MAIENVGFIFCILFFFFCSGFLLTPRCSSASAIPLLMLAGDGPGVKPVLKHYEDQTESITCLDFHPSQPFVISGSRDSTIAFFDHSKLRNKRREKNLKVIQSAHPLGHTPCPIYPLSPRG